MAPICNDIRIIAISKNKTFIWYLRNGKKIGNINIKSDCSKATLCYGWDHSFELFLNEYFFKDMKDFLHKQSDELLFFKIEKVSYHTMTLKEIDSKDDLPNLSRTIFEWKKQEDEYYSFS